jgi:hypothetical protein
VKNRWLCRRCFELLPEDCREFKTIGNLDSPRCNVCGLIPGSAGDSMMVASVFAEEAHRLLCLRLESERTSHAVPAGGLEHAEK